MMKMMTMINPQHRLRPDSNDIDDAVETLTKLSLFTDDAELDSLLSKWAPKITQIDFRPCGSLELVTILNIVQYY